MASSATVTSEAAQEAFGAQQASNRIEKVAVLADEIATHVAELMAAGAQYSLTPQEAAQLRELSLTLVAWDRMLYTFVINRLKQASVELPPAGGALAEAVER